MKYNAAYTAHRSRLDALNKASIDGQASSQGLLDIEAALRDLNEARANLLAAMHEGVKGCSAVLVPHSSQATGITMKLLKLGTIVVASLAVFFPVRDSNAARFPNLYRVTVEATLGTPDRTAALELAMSKVLVRVTGRREAAADPKLEPLLGDPDRYLVLFGSDLQGRTVVGFNSSLVNQTLISTSWPIWGRERPLTLVWIAIDDGQGERAMLSKDEQQADASDSMEMRLDGIRQQVLAVADERGLPLAFPVLDAQDLETVTFVDVWSGFEDRILSASARYRPDAVLVGRVRPTASGNEVTWLLLENDSHRTLASGSIHDGVDAVADLYAAEFSTTGDQTSVRVRVLNVETFADYGRVMSYLAGLTVVGAVDVESLHRGVLTLRARARGDALVVERVLALGGVLSPERRPPSADPSGPLVFRIARPFVR